MANKVLQQGAIRPILATAPSGLAGIIYYDSGLSKLRFYNGASFVEIADFGQLGSTTSGSSGAKLVGGDNKAYSNIAGLTTYTLQDFLDRINLALGSAGGSSFSDAAFEVYNSAAPTKKIALDASGITAGQTRTLKMADANVDLAALDNTNIAAAAAIAVNKLAAVTASRALVSDASGFVSASTVTSATLAFLDATSSVQTQLNGKEPTITTLPIAKGGTNSSTALNNGRVMSSVAGAIVEAAAITASRALISDANGIPTHSTVTSATLAFLDATSSVQTQLNGKEPTITTLPIAKGGTNSSTALNNSRVMTSVGGAIVEAAAITASKALVSDSNGIPVASTVSTTTLEFLDATSSVQTQINSKVAKAGDTMTGTLAMGANKVTSSYVPLNADDLVNKAALDNAITGLSWKNGVQAFNLRGNLTIAGIDGLSPVQGDQYVATDAGTPAAGTSDALAAGDIAEFNGTSWKKIVSNSGGFVPLGTRAVLGGSGASIGAPYTNGTDNDKIVSFTGASNTGTITSDTANNSSIFVQDPGHISYYDNSGFVYEGSPTSGSWIQFSGAGQISAGVGLSKTGNTLDVKLGAGIAELPTDEVGIHLWGTAPGLILTTDGTSSSTATGAQLRAYDIADANIASAAAIAVNKLAAVTASRALVSDASGFVSASTVTSATLAFLDATSSVQTQLNGKEPTITTLSIAKGGTNSSTALNNGRIMSTVAGAIVEAAAITAARVLISDANGIPVHSTVTSATLAFLDATSSIQTQLNGKEPTITTLPIAKGGTNSGTALNNDRVMISSAGAVVEASAITANRALVSNASGIPVASSVTTTTLEFLDATSSVQTQLNGKLANVVEDTTPQLGGALDPNGQAITNTVRFGASAANSVEQDYLHAQSLTASTTAVLATLTFDSKVYKSLMIEYTARNGNNRRTGSIMVSADNISGVASSVVQLFHEELDTTDLSLTWSCAMNGDNVEVSYTTGAGTYVANMLVKRFKA